MGGTVTVDTTDRQVLLDLVAVVQKNNHPVTVDSLSESVAMLTGGRAQITKVMNLKQDPPPEPVKPIVPRIGDAERTRTCDLLATHFTEGRLTQQEFDERSSRAIAALHQPELDALLVDMPKVAPPSPLSPVRKALDDLKMHEVKERQRRRELIRSTAIIAYAIVGVIAMILIVMKVR